jgi:3-dehydroquinate synthase
MQSTPISKSPYIINESLTGGSFENWLKSQSFTSLFILVDKHTHVSCLPYLSANNPILKTASILEISPGERSKSIEIAMDLWKSLLNKGADRQSILINLGGGVVGDLGGFVASVFMRGIRFVQIPTTLLAQVDASIGGKTGVNFHGIKNILGSFQQPEAVFADCNFLNSLPTRELVSGYAEIVKHALIAGGDVWNKIKNTNPLRVDDWSSIVTESILQKKAITDADFKESGYREVLNLGHTIAHALESLYFKKNKQLTHGEAVAAGICIESRLAVLLNILDENEFNQVQNYIHAHFTPVEYTANDLPELLDHIQKDKKNEQSNPAFSLLQGIGKVITRKTAAPELIIQALTDYAEFAY